MDIREVIKRPEYRFLYEQERLGDNIILLAFGGSYAYGTNTAGSDIDIRGITAPRKEDILGLPMEKTSDRRQVFSPSGFEQFINTETDTTIYSLDKMVRLLSRCNPNTIEILGCRPQDYAKVSEAGKLLLDNSDAFLSKLAYGSFSGFARQQLFRLKNALARDSVSEAERQIHMIGSVERMYTHLEEVYPTFRREMLSLYLTDLDGNRITVEGDTVTLGSVSFRYCDSTCTGMDISGKEVDPNSVRVCADVDMNGISTEDLAGIYSEVSAVIRDYNAHKGHRNNKKDAKSLNKHAMHVIRTHLMTKDILKDHRIVTYREKEHDMLMAVRDGFYMRPDGTYKDEFYRIVDDNEKELRKIYEETTLPDLPDAERINRIVMQIKGSVLGQ